MEGASETKAKGEWTNIVFSPCLPTSFWVFSRMTWTQTKCALSVFFRDAKFLLEEVGITKKKKKRKKENPRVVFFSCLAGMK